MRGRLIHLKAHALSLKQGAKGDEIKVNGQVVAGNKGIPDYDFEVSPSVIGRISVGGKRIS